QEMGERVAVVSRELEADQEVCRAVVREHLTQMRVRLLEALPVHEDLERRLPTALRPARHELVERLAGVHADVPGEPAGKQVLLVRSHSAPPRRWGRALLPERGEAPALRPSWRGQVPRAYRTMSGPPGRTSCPCAGAKVNCRNATRKRVVRGAASEAPQIR